MGPLMLLAAVALADPLPAPTGAFALGPTELAVQSKQTVTIVYTVGPGGMSTGDAIRLQDPHFHGMRWAKWGYLVTDAASCSPLDTAPGGSSAGVVAAYTNQDDVILQVSRNDVTAALHNDAWTDITLSAGSLQPGETIRVVMGDTTLGPDCGLQTSPRTMPQVQWPVWERLGGATDFTQVQGPYFSFVTDLPIATLLVSVPSQALVGEPFPVTVAAMDELGNATRNFTGLVILGDQRHVFTPQDDGLWHTTAQIDTTGVARLSAATGEIVVASNPVSVDTEMPDLRVYWGDLHTHYGHQYVDDVGDQHDLNHDYGRDVVGLQFGSESFKAYPHYLDWESNWAELQASCVNYTEDERYVALLSFEWMGNVTSPGFEGHHNVYYNGCNGPLAPESLVGLTGREDSLWVFMANAEADYGVRSLSIPHAPVYTGFNWRDRDDTLRPLAEIYSEWGDSAPMNTQGSSVYNALALGQRMGILAASDNHDGWIGNRWAYKNAAGGLAAIVATDLSRDGLFEAMLARSTYGTTGIRPILRFTAEDGAQVEMGAEYVAEDPVFHWSYSAERSIVSVELLAVGLDGQDTAVRQLASWSPTERDASGEYALTWDGAPLAVWLHVTEAGDEQAWSSPIWLAADCGPGVQDPARRCEEDSPPVDDSHATDDSTPQSDDSTVDTEDSSNGKDRSRCGGCGGGRALLLLPLLLLRRRKLTFF